MKTTRPPRILIIEDNPGDIGVLRYGFDKHRWEYELEILRDGEEALKYIRLHHAHVFTGAQPPCVIVLDIHLPKVNGISVLKAIKQDYLLAHVHVVVLSTMVSLAERETLLSLGADLYREKPSELEGFVSLSEEIMALCDDALKRAAVV
jgi:CheY-like chemotaxis protein